MAHAARDARRRAFAAAYDGLMADLTSAAGGGDSSELALQVQEWGAAATIAAHEDAFAVAREGGRGGLELAHERLGPLAVLGRGVRALDLEPAHGFGFLLELPRLGLGAR